MVVLYLSFTLFHFVADEVQSVLAEIEIFFVAIERVFQTQPGRGKNHPSLKKSAFGSDCAVEIISVFLPRPFVPFVSRIREGGEKALRALVVFNFIILRCSHVQVLVTVEIS